MVSAPRFKCVSHYSYCLSASLFLSTYEFSSLTLTGHLSFWASDYSRHFIQGLLLLLGFNITPKYISHFNVSPCLGLTVCQRIIDSIESFIPGFYLQNLVQETTVYDCPASGPRSDIAPIGVIAIYWSAMFMS